MWKKSPESDYHRLFQSYRRKSSWREGESIPFTGGELFNLPFESRNSIHLLGRPSYRCEEHGLSFEEDAPGEAIPDCEIRQNARFLYPLLRPPAGNPPRRMDRVTILLHGLNERSYSKYMPWAHDLCVATGAPVLLFPLALHVNRVLPVWASSQSAIAERRRQLRGNEFAHRFNAIVSERLEQRPQRFFWGAVQSYLDLVDLARQIRSGRHPHFLPGARVDFLGYSAGGYISFFLMLENPESLFTDSRAVLFASAVPARELNLASPLILDLAAETGLMRLFVKSIDQLASPRMKHWFESHGEGRWIRALSGLKADRRKVETRLAEIAPRVLGIANVNDDVTPLNAMLDSLEGLRRNTGVRVVELDLGLHENPFVDLGGDRLSRRGLTEFLDSDRYGAAFESFIEAAAAHLTDPVPPPVAPAVD